MRLQKWQKGGGWQINSIFNYVRDELPFNDKIETWYVTGYSG